MRHENNSHTQLWRVGGNNKDTRGYHRERASHTDPDRFRGYLPVNAISLDRRIIRLIQKWLKAGVWRDKLGESASSHLVCRRPRVCWKTARWSRRGRVPRHQSRHAEAYTVP